MLKALKTTFALLITLLLFSVSSEAQTEIAQDYSRLMNIPAISAIQSSTSHLYVLSETEGMAVFRVHEDSLQWLYTSSGMQRRGYKIEADIRFAYLWGDSRRLTVLEPTSVLGVYSSTQLPVPPLGVARLDNQLFVALGTEGLGQLSLDTPETVDTDPEIVGNNDIGRADVLDVESSIISGQLFVLTNDQRIAVFSLNDSSVIELEATVTLNKQIHNIFLDNDLIWGTTRSGDVYEVNGNGLGRQIGSIGEAPADLVYWRNRLFVRGISGRVWVSENNRGLQLWKSDGSANHHLTKSGNTVWMNVYDKLSPLTLGNSGTQQATGSGTLKLRPINNMVLTYPKPLLLGIELINYPASDVEFVYRSNVTNASIKKQGFYWQPNVNQVGYNWFTIIATNSEGQVDSVRFNVDVRTFNSPPRFSPVRNSSIVVNDPYELKFNAVDPENPANSLIRYLGVDLPDGSTLDERTGLFKWTPTERHVGEVTFRIIATDEQGAAASQDITLNVINISRDGE